MNSIVTGEFPYIHGFSSEEQSRLTRQARMFENTLFSRIDFSESKRLLEVGCGVGAQTEILLRRFPHLELTGVDRSEAQLAAAERNLAQSAWCTSRLYAAAGRCHRPAVP